MTTMTTTTTSPPSPSPFHIPLDLSRTALLLTDIQTDILSRFPPADQEPYLHHIHTLLTLFRNEITRRRSTTPNQANTGIPLIIHHILPHGLNSNAFLSPSNKLSVWAQRVLPPPAPAHKDPTRPFYPVPKLLVPPGGWGGPDEILLPKFQVSSFASSDLWGYLRAREVRHVVLVGLTAVGAVLGSARQGADLDLHVVVVREGVMEEEREVGEFVLERVLGRFVDVVDLQEVVGVFGGSRGVVWGMRVGLGYGMGVRAALWDAIRGWGKLLGCCWGLLGDAGGYVDEITDGLGYFSLCRD